MERRRATKSGRGGADQAALLERGEHSLGDLVEGAGAVDLLDDPAGLVDTEDRRRLALVDRETAGDGLFGVVGAALLLGAKRQAGDALLARHHELDDRVELIVACREEVVEIADLCEVARESVEQEAA